MNRKRVFTAFAVLYVLLFVVTFLQAGVPAGPSADYRMGQWAAQIITPAIIASFLVFVPLLLIRGVIRGKDFLTAQIR